jgi:hypothetical protein
VTVSDAAVDVADTVVDLTATATSVAEPDAPEQASQDGETDLQLALEAERAEAKHAHELAREPYRSLTKAELSALLAERG